MSVQVFITDLVSACALCESVEDVSHTCEPQNLIGGEEDAIGEGVRADC